jgi:adenosylmethionine-8-amino-7-oxononanoate aminotransferase
MNVSRYEDDLQRCLWAPFTQMAIYRESPPVIIKRGRGTHVWDTEGNEYLDASGGLWLVNVGYGRREIVEAVSSQLEELPYFYSFRGFSNERAIELAVRLVELLRPEGMGKVFFTGSGSESVETALKIARQYWKLRGEPGRYKFISRWGGYHGITFGALSVSGITPLRSMFEPLLPGTVHIPPPHRYRCQYCQMLPDCSLECAEELKRCIEREGAGSVAAFIAEPVMGGGGVIIPHKQYLQRIEEICKQYNILLILDEVITGFGRIGDWFGARRFGVKPDLMTFAKGLTSGYLPLGAVAVRDEIYEAFLGNPNEGREFRHGNTYAGHPAACAAALANIEIIVRENLPGCAEQVGRHLLKCLRNLEQLDCVGDVNGIGLLARVELVKSKLTKAPFAPDRRVGFRVSEEALKHGLIVRPLGDVLTFSPPLILSDQEAEFIADTTMAAIAKVQAEGF